MAASSDPALLVDIDTWAWGRVHANYEAKNEKGITELINATEFPKQAKSLPLVGYPFGRDIEPISDDQKGRGDIPVRLQLVDNKIVRVTFYLDELHPRMVPQAKIDQSRYTFRTAWMTRKGEMKQTFPDVVVDTTALLRSSPYPSDMKLEDIEDVMDKDLDLALLEYYETGQVAKPSSIPKDKRLKDYYSNDTPVPITAERRFKADGKTFDCIRVYGHYLHEEFSKKCASPPYFDFDIVPIRQEFEYANLCSVSAERTVRFRSLSYEFHKDVLPVDVKEWMMDMHKNMSLRTTHQYKEYIQQEIERRAPMTRFWSAEDEVVVVEEKKKSKSDEDDDESSSCPIPIDLEKLEDYLNEMGQALYYQYVEQQSEDETNDEEEEGKDNETEQEEEEEDQEAEEEEETEAEHEDEKGEEGDEGEGEDDEEYLTFINQLYEHVGKNAEQLREIAESRCRLALKFLEFRRRQKEADEVADKMKKLSTNP
jgi:hypothetical protein